MGSTGKKREKVVENGQTPASTDPPLGMYAVKPDSAGRMKLPADFLEYFAALGHTKFFVTSLDRSLGTIYPLSLWRATEKFLENDQQDPELSQAAAFNAADLGGKAELDGNGRLLLPAELRKELGLENGPVRLKAAGECVDIFSEATYEALRERGKTVGPAGMAKLRQLGIPK